MAAMVVEMVILDKVGVCDGKGSAGMVVRRGMAVEDGHARSRGLNGHRDVSIL